MAQLALKNGSRVAIIGGGPAGSFSAYFLQKYAMAQGLELQICIFDGKDFLSEGPRGCNLCAGVIAESLSKALEQEGIVLPEERILSRLDGYILHVGEDRLCLIAEDGSRGSIAAVFRGNGPRYAQFPDAVSFDDYLLTVARDYGVDVISQPISDIHFPRDPSLPLQLKTESKGGRMYEADLVVGAFGVNTRLADKIEGLGFGYQRPSTLVTYQAEIKLRGQSGSHSLENMIHVFMPRSRFLRYITLTPKREFVTITMVGQRGIDPRRYPELMRRNFPRDTVDWDEPQCSCFPRIVTSSAKRPYADRMVMVGDASYSRYYKNGIESAFITARLIAKAAVFHGIDAKSFAEFYHRPASRIISRDNEYGRFLFYMNDVISRLPVFREIHLQLAETKNDGPSARKIRAILWNMFTGNAPYKNIFFAVFDLGLQASLLRQAWRIVIDCIKKLLK